jgi:predicted NBD/HSP70 family sugar kinase
MPPSTLDSTRRDKPGGTILMARASLAALTRHLRFHNATPRDHVFTDSFLQQHQALFDDWADDAADALALPVLTATHLLDVDHVIVAGDLPTSALDAIGTRVTAAMGRIVAESRVPPRLLTGQVGPWAASVGAGSLPLHDSFSPARDSLTGSSNETPLEARP